MTDIRTADLDVVAGYAEKLPNAWLLCRELGHNWAPHSARVTEDGGFDRILRCRRCPTKRHQILDSYGRIMSNQYDYPEGYQMPAGQGRITGDGRGVLRVASIRHDIAAAEGRTAAPRKTTRKSAAKKAAPAAEATARPAARRPRKSTSAAKKTAGKRGGR